MRSIAAQVLATVSGFTPQTLRAHEAFVHAVADLLHPMLGGTPALHVLRRLEPSQPLYLERGKLTEAVAQEVDATEAVEVHRDHNLHSLSATLT